MFTHILLFVAFCFHFILTRFVILVGRWSGHEVWCRWTSHSDIVW